jgi:uncharacterized cupin superfamily protein
MEIVREAEIIHSNQSNDPSYPYSKSAQLFHTNQLFLYSEKVGPSKKSSAPHYHRSIDEIAYITHGEIYAIEGENEILLKAGDSILFKANSQEKHYFENRSKDDAEFLLFRRSTSQDDVVY